MLFIFQCKITNYCIKEEAKYFPDGRNSLKPYITWAGHYGNNSVPYLLYFWVTTTVSSVFLGHHYRIFGIFGSPLPYLRYFWCRATQPPGWVLSILLWPSIYPSPRPPPPKKKISEISSTPKNI